MSGAGFPGHNVGSSATEMPPLHGMSLLVEAPEPE